MRGDVLHSHKFSHAHGGNVYARDHDDLLHSHKLSHAHGGNAYARDHDDLLRSHKLSHAHGGNVYAHDDVPHSLSLIHISHTFRHAVDSPYSFFS